jgi:hypothetical protein
MPKDKPSTTRPAGIQDAIGGSEKPDQFLQAAKTELELGRTDVATSNAVNAGILAADAICAIEKHSGQPSTRRQQPFLLRYPGMAKPCRHNSPDYLPTKRKLSTAIRSRLAPPTHRKPLPAQNGSSKKLGLLSNSKPRSNGRANPAGRVLYRPLVAG